MKIMTFVPFIVLSVLVGLVFSPALKGQFLNWDDYAHYVSNPCVYSLSWHNLVNLFQQTINDTYIPLTTLSFNLEYHVFGVSSFVSHWINILLHLAVVGVIFNFAQRLKFSVWESFVAASIFALHPIHVESVAWVTERKDVLGILFYVLCLKQYWKYLDTHSKKDFAISLLFGFLSILTKAMAVSLPWTLLLLDWYHQRRFNKYIFLDKIPFALVIFPIAAITFLKLSPHPHVVSQSALVGFWSFTWYLEKFVLPFNLLPAYTAPLPVAWANGIYLKSLMIFAVFFGLMWAWRKNRLFMFAGLFWISTIFFFWRFDFTDNNIVADRFMYLPSIGFCLLFGKYASKFKAGAVGLIVILGFLSFKQCAIWENDHSLWEWTIKHDGKSVLAKANLKQSVLYVSTKKRADYKALTQEIDRNPSSSEAYLKRGEALLAEGNYFVALSDFNQAIQLDATNDRAFLMRGQLYSTRMRYSLALLDFDQAIKMNPSNDLVLVKKASVLQSMGRTQEALAYFNQALDSNPQMSVVYLLRGILYHNQKEYAKATADFSQAIALGVDLKSSYYQRAKSFEALNQLDQAAADFNNALKQDESDIKTLNDLSIVYLKNKDTQKAMELLNQIISKYPYNENAFHIRGLAYVQQKQYDFALKDFTVVIELKSDSYEALINRGDVHVLMGNVALALKDYQAAFLFSNNPIARTKRDQVVNLQ